MPCWSPGEPIQATQVQLEAHLQGRLHCDIRTKTNMTPKGRHTRLLGTAWGTVPAAMLQALTSEAQPRCTALAESTHHSCPCGLQLVLMVGSSGEAARCALQHGPGEVPSAATVVSELQALAGDGDPDSTQEAAACLDALQADHAGVTGDERTDLA